MKHTLLLAMKHTLCFLSTFFLVSCGELLAYRSASDSDTIPAYREYLDGYPGTVVKIQVPMARTAPTKKT